MLGEGGSVVQRVFGVQLLLVGELQNFAHCHEDDAANQQCREDELQQRQGLAAGARSAALLHIVLQAAPLGGLGQEVERRGDVASNGA